jgi:hypothetical protein
MEMVARCSVARSAEGQLSGKQMYHQTLLFHGTGNYSQTLWNITKQYGIGQTSQSTHVMVELRSLMVGTSDFYVSEMSRMLQGRNDTH